MLPALMRPLAGRAAPRAAAAAARCGFADSPKGEGKEAAGEVRCAAEALDATPPPPLHPRGVDTPARQLASQGGALPPTMTPDAERDCPGVQGHGVCGRPIQGRGRNRCGAPVERGGRHAPAPLALPRGGKGSAWSHGRGRRAQAHAAAALHPCQTPMPLPRAPGGTVQGMVDKGALPKAFDKDGAIGCARAKGQQAARMGRGHRMRVWEGTIPCACGSAPPAPPRTPESRRHLFAGRAPVWFGHAPAQHDRRRRWCCMAGGSQAGCGGPTAPPANAAHSRCQPPLSPSISPPRVGPQASVHERWCGRRHRGAPGREGGGGGGQGRPGRAPGECVIGCGCGRWRRAPPRSIASMQIRARSVLQTGAEVWDA